MRILQLIHTTQRRGAEIFAVQLTKELTKTNVQCDILAIYKNDRPQIDHDYTDLAAREGKAFVDFAAVKRLAKRMKAYDIVQANSGDTLRYAALAKLVHRVKTPLVFRNASTMSQYLSNPIQKWIYGRLLSFTQAIASVSNVSKKDITRLYPFLENRAHTIPIGINTDRDIDMLKRTKNKVIVHVGGFTFEKNHAELIDIFQNIRSQDENVELWLIGDGPLRKDIERKVEEFGLQSSVTFHGFVTNPMDYIKSADVLVLTSIIEGLPGVILESFFCGTPAVAYDVGGVSEILNDDTGSLVPKGDSDAFVQEVLRALNEDYASQVKRRIENAKILVESEFSNAQIAAKFMALYGELSR